LEDLGADGRIILKYILRKEDVDWTHLAQDRMTDCVERSNETSGSIKTGNFLTSWATISFSRRSLLN
jgi:hypothetical protein